MLKNKFDDNLYIKVWEVEWVYKIVLLLIKGIKLNLLI